MTEPLLGRGDALLQLAHLGLQRRLVADLRGHPPEQRRDLGAGLHEAEDVVDEQQHVLALVAEVFGHRQARQRHAHARSGRLVHLAEDEHRLVEHARLLHLQPQVVALARALADAAERRQAAVLLGEVVDQLLDQHGLADAGAAEQADLAALRVGREQVDDLDARSRTSRSSASGPRRAAPSWWMLRGAACPRAAGSPRSIGSPSRLKMRPSVASPTGTVIGRARVDHLGAAREAVGRVHRDRAHAVVAEVLLDLADEHVLLRRSALMPSRLLARGRRRARDGDRVVDLGQRVGEDGLDHDALDLLDAPDVARACSRAAAWCSARMAVLASIAIRFSSVSVQVRGSVAGIGRIGRPSSEPSAPATTSMISCVISAWRARFISSVSR